MAAKRFASRALLCAGACMLCGTMRASALTIADHRKYSDSQQATYVTAAVSMMLFNFAANKDARSRCVSEWYFKGQTVDGRTVPPTGPAEMAREIARVGGIDSTYHVEEIVLDMIKKACGAPPK